MNKEKQQITELLERFFNGESTIEEEDLLGRYFATHEVADEWLPYKQMFAYFDAGMSNEKPVVKVRKLKRLWRYTAVAASIAVLVSGAIYVMRPTQKGLAPHPVAQMTAETIATTSSDKRNVAEMNTASIEIKKTQSCRKKLSSVSRQTYLDADSAEINKIINANMLAEMKVEENYALLEERINVAQNTIDEDLAQLSAEESNVVQVMSIP